MKLVEFTIISGRTLLINPDQIVYVCTDLANTSNCHLYLSNQDFYSVKMPLEELLKKLNK